LCDVFLFEENPAGGPGGGDVAVLPAAVEEGVGQFKGSWGPGFQHGVGDTGVARGDMIVHGVYHLSEFI